MGAALCSRSPSRSTQLVNLTSRTLDQPPHLWVPTSPVTSVLNARPIGQVFSTMAAPLLPPLASPPFPLVSPPLDQLQLDHPDLEIPPVDEEEDEDKSHHEPDHSLWEN
jgi:hypothetical protein